MLFIYGVPTEGGIMKCINENFSVAERLPCGHFSERTLTLQAFNWRSIYTCINLNRYVGLPYCRTEIDAGRVECCHLMSHGEYADGTDGRTPDR